MTTTGGNLSGSQLKFLCREIPYLVCDSCTGEVAGSLDGTRHAIFNPTLFKVSY